MKLAAVLTAALLAGSSVAHGQAAGGGPSQIPVYYAYVSIGNVDMRYQPILGADGKQTASHFCLLWMPNWIVAPVNEYVLSSPRTFFGALSYQVDPHTHMMVIDRLTADKVLEVGNKIERLNGFHLYLGPVKVQMYPQPKPGWPCTEADWMTTYNNLQVVAIDPAPQWHLWVPAPMPHKSTVPTHPVCMPDPETLSGLVCRQSP